MDTAQNTFNGFELSDDTMKMLAEPAKKRKTRNYVNNADFYDAIVAYQDKCTLMEQEGKEKPIVPSYIYECFYHIANNYSRKAKFINYPYREDMVMDAVSDCLKYMHNFNRDKGKNPFAYFTRYAHNAFIQRISEEKMELYVKYKLSIDMINSEGTYTGGEDVSVYLTSSVEYINKYIEDFEGSIERKRLKKEAKDAKKKLLGKEKENMGVLDRIMFQQ